MIATRQKKNTVNAIVKKMLQDGIYPTLSDILSRTATKVKGKIWGSPMTTFRPAVDGYPIGGENGTDIEDTFTEMREDLVTLSEEIIDTADKTITYYNIFSAKKEYLKRRLLKLIQSADAMVTMFATGNSTLFQDTFNTNENIDTTSTTAELCLEGGYATLPSSTDSVGAIDVSSAEVSSESYPTTGAHGSILSILSDSTNTAWYASLNCGTYTVIIKLSDEATTEINAIYIQPLTPMDVVVSYSNDSYNYYTVASEHIYQETTWELSSVAISHIKLEITADGTAGIKRMKLLSIGYEDSATLQSIDYSSEDIFGEDIGIESVSLSVDESCPTGTSIDYYISSVHTGTGVRADWIKASDSTIWLTSRQEITQIISAATLITGEDEPYPLYTHVLGANPILESSSLIKGNNQFEVQFVDHDWSDDADPNHSPTLADWDSFDSIITGYFSPITYNPDNSLTLTNSVTAVYNGTTVTLGTGIDPLQHSDNVLLNYRNMLGEANKLNVSENTYDSNGWMIIGIAGNGASASDSWILARDGNYKFTTYVYMPSDTVLTAQPALVLNPSYNYGTGTPVIAPFKIYLNGDIVADSKYSYSASLSTDTSSYDCSYSFKQGWNKLDILVYVKTVTLGASADTTSIVASGGIGIYLTPNIFQMQRDNRSILIRASKSADTQVSEFAMRQLVKPTDYTNWAWTDSAPQRDLLLNYNPADFESTFDGICSSTAPRIELNYKLKSEDAPDALTFRAILKKESSSDKIPKLYGYKLYVNPSET